MNFELTSHLAWLKHEQWTVFKDCLVSTHVYDICILDLSLVDVIVVCHLLLF